MSQFQKLMSTRVVIGFVVSMAMIGALNVFIFQYKSAPERNYVVGIISPGQGMRASVTGFIEGLKKYGYEEGRNVTYIIHEGKAGVENALSEIVKKETDLLFTMTTPITKKAKAKTTESNLPVVFIMHDPVASGIISSSVKPGANLTGIQVHGDAPKALEWLQLIMPDVKRVFVPTGYENIASIQSLQDLHKTGEQLNIEIVSERVETKEELERALAKMPDDIDAIFAIHSVVVISNLQKVSEIAMKKKVPLASLHHHREATITFGVDGYRAGVRASRLANQILKGISPAVIPTEFADFRLSINLQKAQSIGLTIPDKILLQADDIQR